MKHAIAVMVLIAVRVLTVYFVLYKVQNAASFVSIP